MALAADLKRHFVQMPLIADAYASSSQSCSKGGTKLHAPLANRLMADHDATLGQQILHFAKLRWNRK